MSTRKRVVENYFEGFRTSDRERVLDCLTEDVVWDLPGFKHLEGKEAFDGEIENFPEGTERAIFGMGCLGSR